MKRIIGWILALTCRVKGHIFKTPVHAVACDKNDFDKVYNYQHCVRCGLEVIAGRLRRAGRPVPYDTIMLMPMDQWQLHKKNVQELNDLARKVEDQKFGTSGKYRSIDDE